MAKIKEYLLMLIIGIIYFYNIPILLILMIVSAMGVNLRSDDDIKFGFGDKIVFTIIATIVSTALYIAFPFFFFRDGIE